MNSRSPWTIGIAGPTTATTRSARVADVVDALNEMVHDPWLLREHGEEDGLVHAGSVWAVREVEVAWQEQGDGLLLAQIEDDGSFRGDPFALPANDHQD